MIIIYFYRLPIIAENPLGAKENDIRMIAFKLPGDIYKKIRRERIVHIHEIDIIS